MKKTFYVTTPIYYPSGNLHIGHVYTTTIADALAKYKKATGYETYFLTGSDEHGQKILEIAKKLNLEPIKYLDMEITKFKNLWKELDIDYDVFYRTTNPNHIASCQKIFTKLYNENYIYKGKYKGKYCIPCESSWQTSELIIFEGNKLCPDCQRKVIDVEEDSFFLKIQKQETFIKNLFKKNFLFPNRNIKELNSKFVDKGLNDLSISRTSFDWGVPIKEDLSHIMYVWLDALPNYITSLGYMSKDNDLFKKYWNNEGEIIHIVGKEITRFHCIYWPIILNYLNILPANLKVLGHGWITSEGKKMSKSVGNVIDPVALLKEFSSDHIRYYLLKAISIGDDGDFSENRFIDVYNNDLANGYGNLVSRTMTMIQKYQNNKVCDYKKLDHPLITQLETEIKSALKNYHSEMNNYNITNGLKVAFNLVVQTNGFISNIKPWELVKEKDNLEILDQALNRIFKSIEIITLMFKPILTSGTKNIIKQLNLENSTFDNCLDYEKNNQLTLKNKEIVYPRIKKTLAK